jgi:hypothetical protein
MTKDEFIAITVTLFGDSSKNFSRYETQSSFECCASFINSKLLEKPQHIRDVLSKSMIIISGVPCETFNFSVKGSLVLSRIPNLRWGGLSVGIARTTSKASYERFMSQLNF